MYCTVLCSTTLHYTTLHYTTLHYTTALYCAIPCCTCFCRSPASKQKVAGGTGLTHSSRNKVQKRHRCQANLASAEYYTYNNLRGRGWTKLLRQDIARRKALRDDAADRMVANYAASNERGAGGGMRRPVLCRHELGRRLAVALPAVGEKSPARKGKLYSSALMKERARVARKADKQSRPASSGTQKMQRASTSAKYSQQVVKVAQRAMRQNRFTRLEPTPEELALAQEEVQAAREMRKRKQVNYVESEVEEESEGESSEDEEEVEGSSEGEDDDASGEDDSDLD